MTTVNDFVPAPSAGAETEPSRRRLLPCGGASTSNPTPSSDSASTPSSAAAPVSRIRAAARRTISAITTAALVAAMAAFLFLAVGPRVLSYQTSTMLTGSMAPLIKPGDVVVSAPTPVSEIRVGDIITYHIPVEDQRVETHRVVEILTNGDGTTSVRTKGDANNGADPWTATLAGSSVDRHVLTVPYVGQAIRTLRQPIVLNTLMYGAPAMLVVSLLASIWRKEPKSEASE